MEESENQELNYEEIIDNVIHARAEYLNSPEGMKAEALRLFSTLTDDQQAQLLQIMKTLIAKE